MIAVDVGCARYGGDFSIERLIQEFKPERLYGFDPGYHGPREYEHEGCQVTISKSACWTYDGRVAFQVAGLSGRIADSGPTVPCRDLAAFLRALPDEQEIALKIDAEGAEYQLLEHLIEQRVDTRLKLAWVEWHPPGARVNSQPDPRREAIEAKIGCEMHQWNW